MSHDDTADDVAVELGRVAAELAAAREEIAHLESALSSSRRIGAAIGIVMATSKVLEETAFEVLRTASQNTNRKLRDVADDVVRTGATPSAEDVLVERRGPLDADRVEDADSGRR